jgi:hypothetical protein
VGVFLFCAFAEHQYKGTFFKKRGLGRNFFFVANTFQIQPFHKDWRSRQMWLFVLCQEHNTDINYQ